MKKSGILILIILITFSLISCKENVKEVSKENEKVVVSENFDWLLGNWKRTNDQEENETFEIWKKTSTTEYNGVGFTMQNNDTISQELMQLIKLNEQWALKVITTHETQATVFNMTSYTESEFICENKAHDFPNLIKYWYKGNTLNALVSGGEMKISFEFEKITK